MHLYCPHIPFLLMRKILHCRHVRFYLAMLGDCFAKCHTPYVVSSIAHKTIDDNIMR